MDSNLSPNMEDASFVAFLASTIWGKSLEIHIEKDIIHLNKLQYREEFYDNRKNEPIQLEKKIFTMLIT